MDEHFPASLKALLTQWVQERQEAFLEQVMLTWQEGLGRLAPDEALMERILATLPQPEAPLQAPPAAGAEAGLGAGLEEMEAATTQGEVLKRLLSALTRFTGRSALFVVKQGIATLYGFRGFEGTPRPGTPVVPPPELEELIQGRISLVRTPGPAYTALLGPLSPSGAADLRLLPLRLRHKTVAILLVDSGLGQAIELPCHVQALAYVAEARLAHLASAKEELKAASAPVQPSIPTQTIPDPIQETSAQALDPKVRNNAERSARVLVGDIELYFPAKVTQGQARGNLYAVMRDELDRSRNSFVERYGADLESHYHIFYKTVVQQLCGGDPSRLGPAPWGSS